MDDITFLDASVIYSLLFLPIITIILLFFWASANIKTAAGVQLLGIVILFILGLLAINSPYIVLIEAIAILLLIVWIYAHRNNFLKGQVSFILTIFALQIVYYNLFLLLLGIQYTLVISLACIIPILSIYLLYPWTFGNKKTSQGRIFLMIAFIAQVIITVLIIMVSLGVMAYL